VSSVSHKQKQNFLFKIIAIFKQVPWEESAFISIARPLPQMLFEAPLLKLPLGTAAHTFEYLVLSRLCCLHESKVLKQSSISFGAELVNKVSCQHSKKNKVEL
jgi:hypothetical protein